MAYFSLPNLAPHSRGALLTYLTGFDPGDYWDNQFDYNGDRVMGKSQGPRLPSNLKICQSGIYYFRLSVPPDLRPQFGGRGEIVSTLRTSDHRLAQARAGLLSIQYKAEFARYRQRGELTVEAVQSLAQKVLRDGLADLPKPGPDEPLEDFDDRVDRELDAWGSALSGDRFPDPAPHEDALGIIRDAGYVVNEYDPVLELATQAIARAKIQVWTIASARAHGDHETQPDRSLGGGGVDPVPSTRRQRHLDPMLSTVFDTWIAAGADRVSQNITRDRHIGRAYVLAVIGDIPVADVTRQNIRTLRDLASKLPRDWRSRPAWRGLSARQIIDSGAPGPYLKPGTIRKYVQIIRGALAWALDDGLLDRNVSDGITVVDPEPQGVKRLAWDAERLNRWFASGVYRMPRSEWDQRQWLPLLGLFTGARLAELCGLRLDDVKGGVLELRWREDARLKTAASERVVPVHPDLVGIGWSTFVERRQRAGGQSLWPADVLPRVIPASSFSQWFTKARRAAGVYTPKVDFHSFRATWTTAAFAADIPVDRIQALLGHTTRSVTVGVYRKAVSLDLLTTDMASIEFPGLDLARMED